MKIVQISLVALSVVAASVVADGISHGHGNHHKPSQLQPKPSPKQAPAHHKHGVVHHAPVHRQQQRRPLALAPRPQRRASPLQNLIQRHPVNFAKLRRQPLPDLSKTPIAKLLASNLNGAGRRSAPHAHKRPLRKVQRKKPVNPIQYKKAEDIAGYTKFELHDVIRAREGTEIFEEGEKPDVLHYVSSPEVGNIDLTDKIDERTPVKVSINSEV